MWRFSELAPAPFSEPWTTSPQDRLAALKAGHRRLIYFYETVDSTIFRYRVFNMIEALALAPHLGIAASWFTYRDVAFFDRFLDLADALVLCRVRYNDVVARLIRRARARRIPVLFDIDDLVFNLDYVHLIMDSLRVSTSSEKSWNHWFAYVGRLASTLRLCDGAILTNEALACQVRSECPGMPCQVVPNFLNRSQQAVSQQIFDAKNGAASYRDDRIHVGYFSGSPTHARDFQIAAGAVARLMDQDPRIILRIVGPLRLPEALLKHEERIEFLPFQNFLDLQRLIAEVEVNLAPLEMNVFTDCKSELKFFEAGIVGTLTLASPSFSFRQAISDGKNGFLAADHEWERKLKTVVELAAETDAYRTLAHCAHADAVGKFGHATHAAQIASAVFGFDRSAPHRDRNELVSSPKL